MNNNRIIAVNTSDRGGGAEKIACLLHDGLKKRDWDPWLLVGDRKTHTDQVLAFYESPHIDYRPYARPFASTMRQLQKRIASLVGRQDYHHPFSRRIADITGKNPALVHLHNLHGGYFDLRSLPELSHQFPLVLTLEDCWLFSGHCAYPLSCDLWLSGCGKCPSLHIGPEPKKRDATHSNWKEKRSIFQGSRLHVASPSQYLLDTAMKSILAPAIVEARVIPHGVDLDIFKPGERQSARRKLDLPEHTFIASFAANGTRSNRFKDYRTVEQAIKKLGHSDTPLLFLAIGEDGPDLTMGNAKIRHIPFIEDPQQLATHYQACDVFVHAAKNEAFGIVLAEAMACGLPVVATAVDGIPEVLNHGKAGILTPPGDSSAIAKEVLDLMQNPERAKNIADAAKNHANKNYPLEKMIDRYHQWYLEILENHTPAISL